MAAAEGLKELIKLFGEGRYIPDQQHDRRGVGAEAAISAAAKCVDFCINLIRP